MTVRLLLKDPADLSALPLALIWLHISQNAPRSILPQGLGICCSSAGTAGFPVPYTSFLVGTYFTHGSVYMSVLLSLEMILLNVLYSACINS